MPRHLITSALPYINGIKHLGNLIGSLLPADVYARYLRQAGEDVLFICGTDEHGTPAEVAALAEKLPVADYCQKMYARQKEVFESLEISCDYFGRSSDTENHALTQDIFQHLDQNGFIEPRVIQQMYSVNEKRFLPDRYVTGTCPACGYTSARGDQCESCNKLLDPSELIDPYSTLSGDRHLELREEEHLFLKLDVLEKKVDQWVNQHQNWPKLTRGIAYKWLKEGLQARCITRDLKWGVKVPKPGFEDKVFYVWFDAPIAYIGMTQAWAKSSGAVEAWKDWWQPEDPETVSYTQFMAKDNVPFHAIFWPGMLIGADQNWKMVDEIKSFNWLTYDGGKFSTSQRRGVFLDQALDLFPADYWRYVLMSIAPESNDSDFNFERFALAVNKDLNDTLGNFVSRSIALIHKYFDGKLPEADLSDPDLSALEARCLEQVQALDATLSDREFRQAAQALRALWVEGNEFISQRQPWMHAKTDLAHAGTTLNICVHLIKTFAHASAPIMPSAALRLMESIGSALAPESLAVSEALSLNCLPAGHQLPERQQLFNKVDMDHVKELDQKFEGMN